jgi:1,4-dihydroxy-2-naphthoate octaprenyltransferase
MDELVVTPEGSDRVYARRVRGFAFRVRQLGAFVRLGRPLFLVGGFIFYGLGAAAAAFAAGGRAIDWRLYLWGQAAVTAAHLMTHYCNDYFDFDADRANSTPTRWSGGSRVLPAGELPRAAALIAALVLVTLACLATGVLVSHAGAPPFVVALMAAIVVLSWEYSAPPLRLHSTGWGELNVAVVVSGLVPLTGFYIQAAQWTLLPFLAIAPIAGLQFTMLLAIEFPDAAGDAATGKKTLVVRYGVEWTARLYQGVLIAVYLSLPVLVAAGLPAIVAGCALLTSPIAAWQVLRMRRGAFRDPAKWESIAFWSVALLVMTAAAELVGFVLARSQGLPSP